MKKFKLCGDKSCCPEVTVDKDEVVIVDDDGGKVRLTREELEILWEKLK
jgi:hypothetical protein